MEEYMEERSDPKGENPVKFTKLSVVGYSLGGLWARYALGILLQKKMLKVPGICDEGQLEPVLFTTFATPHAGARFQGKTTFTKVFTSLGTTLLGQSGKDLFLKSSYTKDGRPVLEQMADPKSVFYKALASFKYLMLYANSINDRTVPFYTAYLTNKDPFVNRDHIHVVHRKVPIEEESTRNSSIESQDRPLMTHRRMSFAEIDLAKSRYVREPPKTDSASTSKKFSWMELRFYSMIFILGPFVIPTFMILSGVHTITSNLRIRAIEAKSIGYEIQGEHKPSSSHTQRRRRESISEGVASLAGTTVDDFLGPLDQEESDSSDDQSESVLSSSIESGLLTSEDIPALNISPAVLSVIDNLNTLPWEKHVVRFHRLHSHAEIVNRRHKPGQGEDLIRDWVQKVSVKISN